MGHSLSTPPGHLVLAEQLLLASLQSVPQTFLPAGGGGVLPQVIPVKHFCPEGHSESWEIQLEAVLQLVLASL